MFSKRASKLSIVAGALFLASAILPTAVHAANTCNAFIAISYSSTQAFHGIGDTLQVTLTVGAGSIRGGTLATINRVRFELDCDSGSPLGLNCVDDGAIIQYLGDATITTDCPRTFSTGHAAGTAPNQIVFTPNSPFNVLANNPSFCNINFGVAVAALSTDPTPAKAEEVTGYSAANADVRCDNNLSSAGSQSGSILLCPDCDDDDVCTTDSCNRDAGTCVNTDVPCTPDNNACTTQRCDPVQGCLTDPVTCTPDNNACTTQRCDPAQGCVTDPVTCTPDNNACTTERCDPATGCVTDPVTCTPDNNACTTQRCDPAQGCVTDPVTCTPDNNACTTERCDPATGCVTDPVTCTPDNNACTTERCDPATGCVTDPVTCTPDNNACTTERCDPVKGCVSDEKVCNDNDKCTTDRCDPATGQCVFTPKGCGDGNPCTDNICDPATGECKNPPKVCDDGNKCTRDKCDPVTGNCVFEPVVCNDNNACTTDTCDPATGQCKYTDTKTPTCNDNNACTTDRCVPATGQCENIDNKTPTCNDNNACTTDRCKPATGQCENVDNKTPTCNDNNACTTDRCKPATGQCENVDNKTPTCNDNNACTTDRCKPATGQCENIDNKTPTCNDNNACTTDRCDPATGQCKSTDTTTCNDNNSCTTDRCDPATGQCVFTPTGGPTATLDFRGNTASSGTLGNIRTFTAGSLSVKASAFTRNNSNGSWATSYLGSYGGGLGVTSSAEGSGGNDSHTIDNVGGQKDYVLLEFNGPVTLDQLRLGYIATAAGFGPDSDLSLWIGTKTNPYTNHNTLSDAFLTSLGAQEDNNTSSTTTRMADVNAAGKSGNVIVIAAATSGTNDGFKVQHILTGCPEQCPPSVSLKLEGNTATKGTVGNVRTFTTGSVSVKASAFTRNSNTGSWATAYLGAYGGGLGVTSSSESGNSDTHTIDNVGGERNYVLLEFSGSVVLDEMFLGYIATAAGFGPDSDLAVWIGTKTNPYTNHNTLSDAFLTSLGAREDNDTTLTTTRTADVNNAGVRGNVVVISASVADTTPDDGFKVKHLQLDCPKP